MSELMKVAFGDVYADALVCDQSGTLLFASFYGRNADIQSLLASLALKTLTRLSFGHGDHGRYVNCAGQAFTKKVTKVTTPSFGVLDQLFLYQSGFNQLDHETKTSLLIADTAEQLEKLLWGTVCQLSEIPLLPHWRQTILTNVLDDAIQTPGVCIGPVHVRQVHLPDDFELQVSELVRTSMLTVQ